MTKARAALTLAPLTRDGEPRVASISITLGRTGAHDCSGSTATTEEITSALEHGDFPAAYIVDSGTDSQLLLLYQVGQNRRGIT
jgi:hypothetical protein